MTATARKEEEVWGGARMKGGCWTSETDDGGFRKNRFRRMEVEAIPIPNYRIRHTYPHNNNIIN